MRGKRRNPRHNALFQGVGALLPWNKSVIGLRIQRGAGEDGVGGGVGGQVARYIGPFALGREAHRAGPLADAQAFHRNNFELLFVFKGELRKQTRAGAGGFWLQRFIGCAACCADINLCWTMHPYHPNFKPGCNARRLPDGRARTSTAQGTPPEPFCVLWQVSWLVDQGLAPLPGQMSSGVDARLLTYSCGGSCGISAKAATFPFHLQIEGP